MRGTWKSYFKGLEAEHRANLRNRLRRLSGRGKVTVEMIASVEQVASALSEGPRLETAAWEGSAGTVPAIRRGSPPPWESNDRR